MKNKLLKIQQELKCKKGQYNNFGKYRYRSCEDILESVKPLLAETKCILTLSDEMVQIGDRYYIEALATITDIETGETIQNTAYAREEESKKGMDGSQITGTASSYARKYALNGMFLIDDTKDADTDEYQNTTTNQETTNPRQEVIDYCEKNGLDMKEIASEYKLNAKSKQEDFKKVLEDLLKKESEK